MPIVRRTISLYLPEWLYLPLRRLKRGLLRDKNITSPGLMEVTEGMPKINLAGDRDVEYSFVAAQMPHGPGEALDFGCRDSYLSLIAAFRGFRVMALDLERQVFPWHHPRVHFIGDDLFKLALPQNQFDLIINCSSVEHVGLVGRYRVTEERPNGDLEAMEHLRKLMRSEGMMLLTIPVGQDSVFLPLHRVYGRERLPRLLEGYRVIHEEFWVKDLENRWVPCKKETALEFKPFAKSSSPSEVCYALAGLVLCPGH